MAEGAKFTLADFKANDRIVWRNRNNRLRHGIVQQVTNELEVLESFPLSVKGNPTTYVGAGEEIPDGILFLKPTEIERKMPRL